jgi:hypothetical protein
MTYTGRVIDPTEMARPGQLNFATPQIQLAKGARLYAPPGLMRQILLASSMGASIGLSSPRTPLFTGQQDNLCGKSIQFVGQLGSKFPSIQLNWFDHIFWVASWDSI